MANKYLWMLMVILCAGTLEAQEEEPDEVRINIEKFIENQESVMDYTDLYDQIDLLLKNPVNLNSADASELAKLPLITPARIQAIISHRKAYGSFRNLFELQQLDGFDTDYIKFILNFVTVAEAMSPGSVTAKGFWAGSTHELVAMSAMKMEKSEGYKLHDSDPNAYKGNALRQVLRYRGDINEHLQINMTSEKDAGEKVNYNSLFVSCGLFFKDMGRIKALAIGDYQASFGQGLTFGSGLAFGKSPFVLNMMRTQNGLRAYRSLNENEFLRGVATTIAIRKNFDISCLYSVNKIDGTTVPDSGSAGDGFSSLINTGYHRSMNELEKKDALRRRIAGGHLAYRNNNLELGVTAVKTFFNKIAFPGSELYQKYNFKGNSIVNYGLDYKWMYKNLVFFGEISANSGLANPSVISGALVSLGKDLDVSLLYRHYGTGYQSSITNAIGEASDNCNENGFYAGVSFTPFKGYKLNAYADLYRFNWLRYLVDAPSSGRDMLVELQYSKRRSYSWYLRYRNEIKQGNEEGTRHLNRMENNNRSLVRFHIEKIISSKFSIRNRVEYVKYNLQYGKTTDGFLMFQDVILSVTNRLKLTGRLMFFDVQDYDARLYAYESDMLYTYTVPAFQNRGTRFYILCKYKLKRNIDIWARFGRTSYENVNETGSGYDKTEGNKTTELKLQIKWAL